MSRGSVWVECEVFMITKTGKKWLNSSDIEYAFSSVCDLNTKLQRELAFERARNKCLKQYRNKHNLSSDDEINYHLLGSGIQYTRLDEFGNNRRTSWKNVRITPARKRALHKNAYLGKNRPIKQVDIKRMEKTETEYEGTKVKETNKYVIDTGKMKHKRPKETFERYKSEEDKKNPVKIVVKRKSK